MAGPDRFLASGHPDMRDDTLQQPDKPPLLGFIETGVNGRSCGRQGLARRAVLEWARRLAARGLLTDEADVFALGEDKIAPALAGDTTLSKIASSRTALLDVAEADGAPLHLGDARARHPTLGCSRRP